MTIGIIIGLSLTTILAGFVQGLSGFGLALVAVPILALFLDIKTVVPLVMLFAVTNNLINVIRLHQHLDLHKVKPVLIGSLPGIPLGAWFLSEIEGIWILLPLAIFLIAYSGYNLIRHNLLTHKINYTPGKSGAYIAGILSGCLSGAFSTGGPPVVIYTDLQHWSNNDKKILLSSYFMLLGIITLCWYLIFGILNSQIMFYFISLLPLLIIGSWAGIFCYEKLSNHHYGRLVNYLLLISGLLLLFKLS
jgi:hypothetical protein